MMKSIDTYFNGNYHRSRLEARWAYFFKRLGVKYEYEPHGFKNSNGDKYLPDFYLPDTTLRGYGEKGVYIEIKPESYEDADIPQSEWFTKPLILFCGIPYKNIWGSPESKGQTGFQISPGWDNHMLFWICQNCRSTKIEHYEGGYNTCSECNSQCDENSLIIAASDAILVRFEHKRKRNLP